jgi:t-SNARE complex subunit (syntaxin)
MENRELTKTRVRNIMNDIPKELKHRRLAKVRNTMKRTFSGMNTLLGQLAQSKTDNIRAAKKRKQKITLIAAIAVAVIVTVVMLTLFN